MTSGLWKMHVSLTKGCHYKFSGGGVFGVT